MKAQLLQNYSDITSLDNLFAAWQEFICGKRARKDVQNYELHLADNIVQLQSSLAKFNYTHGRYEAFNISDPKSRSIHKATVKDRLLHHAVYRQLYPFFDQVFVADSFSCREGKGVHKALDRFKLFVGQVSKNNTRTAWVLKCDIKKFFASINHEVLLDILNSNIPDQNIVWLLKEVISSFSSRPGVGLPLGNLTSQLFCNVYMNELDQFIKHKLRAKHYIRYADDFVLMSDDKQWLISQIVEIGGFLKWNLKLQLHPNKLYIKTYASGVDFLGWTHFPTHRVIRTTSKKRMFRRIDEHPTEPTFQSYLGLLSHGDTYQLSQEVINLHGLLENVE